MSIECPANVVTSASGSAQCVSSSGAPVQWVAVPPFSVAQLDTTQSGEAFAAGFVIVGMCWALGRAVKLIMSVVRW